MRADHASDSFVASCLFVGRTRLRGSSSCFVGLLDVGRQLVGNREIDLVPLLVDHGCVLDEEFERLPAGKIRAYRLQHAPPFEIAPHLCDFLLEPLGEPLDLGVDLVVARPRWPLASTTARSARSASTARAAPTRTSSMNACGSWPVASRYCSSARALVRQPVREIFDAPARLVVDERFGGGSIGTRSAAASSTLSRSAICACSCCIVSRRLRMSARSSSTVSNSLASSTHSSVSSGSTFCFASFTMHAELRVLAGELAEAFGQRRGELEDRAGLACRAVARRARDDHVGADAVQEVGGGEPFDRFAVDRAGDVDRSRTRRR